MRNLHGIGRWRWRFDWRFGWRFGWRFRWGFNLRRRWRCQLNLRPPINFTYGLKPKVGNPTQNPLKMTAKVGIWWRFRGFVGN